MRAMIACLALAALHACTDEWRPGPEGLATFEVEILDRPHGDGERLAIPREPVVLRIRARALDHQGELIPWRGVARIKVTPGATLPSNATLDFEDEDPTDGVAEGRVRVMRVHGDVHVWVQDEIDGRPSGAVGISAPLRYAQPTIADLNQLPSTDFSTDTSLFPGDFITMEREGEVFARREKLGDPCVFADPPPSRRDLIVTSVGPQGFHVTDLAETGRDQLPGHWGHLYVFNFSYPEGIAPGDRIEWLQGTATDYIGTTQLGFPAFRASRCNVLPGEDPDEVLRQQRALQLTALRELEESAPFLDSLLCGGGQRTGQAAQSCGYHASNLHLESLESSLVRVRHIRTPDEWRDCDFDGDGKVTNYVSQSGVFGCPSGDAECACHLACHFGGTFAIDDEHAARWGSRGFDMRGRTCTELNAWRSYGQYAVRLVENGELPSQLNFASRDAVPGFDPFAMENRGLNLSIRGTLSQVMAGRPRWLVHARDASDICCLDGDACPASLPPCP